jgi:acetate CoA/acetoacetate CoA-transferase alpha subunit
LWRKTSLVNVDGKDYLLEKPLRAEIALVKATKADKAGNLICRRATRNFNPVMAMAADLVIAEVDEIVETGAIDPDEVTIPGIFVDYICLSERGA